MLSIFHFKTSIGQNDQMKVSYLYKHNFERRCFMVRTEWVGMVSKFMLACRPSLPGDRDFLYSLYRSTMKPYVEETCGSWNEVQQLEKFNQSLQIGITQIIQFHELDVGMIQIEERSEEVFIVQIVVMPEYQNRGIATQMLRNIVDMAATTGKPVVLQVHKANIRARALYQRLGFGITGENQTHYIMNCEKQARNG